MMKKIRTTFSLMGFLITVFCCQNLSAQTNIETKKIKDRSIDAVENGKINLDEDISHDLPFKIINPNFPNEKIALRHLATHTLGWQAVILFIPTVLIFINREKINVF